MIPVDGTWMRGGVSGDHTGVVVLSLRQEGRRVVGQACHADAGHLLYRDVAVDAPYPRVEFTDPRSGCRYEGGLASPDLIDGWINCPGNPSARQEWPFRRTLERAYADCAGAGP